jgi:hypothetical protein
MMRNQGGVQERLFYAFSLDDHVPKDHLLRGVDRFNRIVFTEPSGE